MRCRSDNQLGLLIYKVSLIFIIGIFAINTTNKIYITLRATKTGEKIAKLGSCNTLVHLGINNYAESALP
jgi:hypothetical protein